MAGASQAWWGRLAVAATLLVAAPTWAESTSTGEQLRSLGEAEAMVTAKVEDRRRELAACARSLQRRWTAVASRDQRTGGPSRGVVKQLLRAKVDELRALERELVLFAERRVELEQEQRSNPPPVSLRLHRPVDGPVLTRFGSYRHPSGVRLVRHTIELGAPAGGPVHAPIDGVVRFAGTLRGFGDAVVLSGEGEALVVVGGVGGGGVREGDSVARGAYIGRSTGERVALAVRIGRGPGLAIDPEPLLP